MTKTLQNITHPTRTLKEKITISSTYLTENGIF